MHTIVLFIQRTSETMCTLQSCSYSGHLRHCAHRSLVKGYKKCCICTVMGETAADMLWNGSEEDWDVRSECEGDEEDGDVRSEYEGDEEDGDVRSECKGDEDTDW